MILTFNIKYFCDSNLSDKNNLSFKVILAAILINNNNMHSLTAL